MTTVFNRWIVAAMAAGLMLGGCATVGPDERRAARLDQFQAAAGAPIESFRYWDLHKWEALGETALAVWTRPDEAYLLRVQRPCTELEWTHAIGLTSSVNRVSANFDSVVVDGQRCRITEIRPVDARDVRSRPELAP